jgi:hypothetical protein
MQRFRLALQPCGIIRAKKSQSIQKIDDLVRHAESFLSGAESGDEPP